jgi:hypothetical protein
MAATTNPRKVAHIKPGSEVELRKIANAVADSGKIVVVTGAGISTNAGIPVGAHVSLLLLEADRT